LRTVAYVEIEAYAGANLVAKMEGIPEGQSERGLDVAPVWTDLKTFPFADFHGCVDIFTAGFPCQPFSCAGKGAADSDPRHLFPYIKRGCEAMRPGIVFLENVEGLISAKLKGDGSQSAWADPAGTPVLLHVLRELERLGYRATAGVFSASEVRAPHQRKRVFILGILDDARSKEPRRLPDFRWEALAALGVSGADVGNAEEFGRREGRAESILRSGRNTVTESSGELAHHHHPRLEGRLGGGVQEYSGERTSREICSYRQFPPGPTDLDAWREVLEVYPTLEPALCSVAHGRPFRVDELRLAGNGVVPATVAKAFVTLWKELKSV